jgi:hypothetical protein
MICPHCSWENDTDTGPCAGCGRELPGSARSSAVPEPRPATPEPAEPERRAAAAPEEFHPRPVPPAAGLLRPASAAVPIDPHARTAPRVIEPGGRRTPRVVDVERSQHAAAARIAPRDVAPQVRPRTVVVQPPGRSTSGGMVVDDAPSGGDTVICRTCGRQVPTELHFCRCGTQVSSTSGVADVVGDLDLQGMTRQRFDRAQRGANGGRRPRFDEPLSMRTWLFRVLLALLVLAAIGSQVPPWGADVRSWVTDRIDAVFAGTDDG